MQDLSNINTIKEILSAHGFTFSKSLGQNFLINPTVCPRMAEACGADENTGVIEIGAGIGVLTAELAKRAKKVVSLELDTRLIPVLAGTLEDFDNVEVLNADVLKTDLHELIASRFAGMRVVVCANLPYYITSPVIMYLLESRIPIDAVTVMVQKEVADRMQSGPGTKDYGALSLAVQFYSKAEIVANVPANCFMPRPNVGSAVIRLTCHEERPVDVEDENFMFKIIRASFNQRRKTLQNGLNNASNLNVNKEQVVAALEKMGLPATVRGEALSLEQFAALSNLLKA